MACELAEIQNKFRDCFGTLQKLNKTCQFSREEKDKIQESNLKQKDKLERLIQKNKDLTQKLKAIQKSGEDILLLLKMKQMSQESGVNQERVLGQI